METHKILLVQLFSNGDCLYATAVARQLKKDFANCHLTWAISSSCKAIIEGNPHVDDVMTVTSVAKNDEWAFNNFVRSERRSKKWDKLVVTHIMGANLANYDGCIRSTIFRGYRYPLNVDVQPVLRLSQAELATVEAFAMKHRLPSYRHVILFEFAPLSGQSALSFEQSLDIAENLAVDDTAVILSSARKISHDKPQIIDGSILSLRETAALTKFSSLLIGCSSGITWITTSDAAKQLPMIQLLNPWANWSNPVSRDFARFGLNSSHLIELFAFETAMVVNCAKAALTNFPVAFKEFNQAPPLHFRTTKNIVYNLLCYCRFVSIIRHIRVNREVFGDRWSFYTELATGILIFPFRLLFNLFNKRRFR